MEQLFIEATRQALRWPSPSGNLSIEDLWDLSLTSKKPGATTLDSIGMDLQRQLKEAGEATSLVRPTEQTATAKLLQIKFDIVKFIIDTKVTERDAENEKAKKAEQKQKLLSILDRKENQELEGKSADELRAMINSL
jgi:hypothetical protein